MVDIEVFNSIELKVIVEWFLRWLDEIKVMDFRILNVLGIDEEISEEID